MHQHERITKNVQDMENRIRELIRDCPQPTISHYIEKSVPKNFPFDTFLIKIHVRRLHNRISCKFSISEQLASKIMIYLRLIMILLLSAPTYPPSPICLRIVPLNRPVQTSTLFYLLLY